MQNLLKLGTSLILLSVSCLLLFYLSVPSPELPLQLPDSVQSLEDADTESPYRRAYFTNYNRDEVLKYYASQWRFKVFGINIPQSKLNYPPEESQTLIRDQTRSTFLEEIVHPFRESLFINGFKPKEAKDEIWYKGKHYEQKITIKYVKSNVVTRVMIMLTSLALLYLVLREFLAITKKLIYILLAND